MKALTLKHPWAWCVCVLGKRVENRVWEPSPGQLKPGEWLAIHGGARPKGADLLEAATGLESLKLRGMAPANAAIEGAILPGIVAVCRLGGVVTESRDPWFNGPFGWLLDGLVALPDPVPCKGKQGLWDLPPDVLEAVRGRYRAATAKGGAPC